jgi:hypothetical protein
MLLARDRRDSGTKRRWPGAWFTQVQASRWLGEIDYAAFIKPPSRRNQLSTGFQLRPVRSTNLRSRLPTYA